MTPRGRRATAPITAGAPGPDSAFRARAARWNCRVTRTATLAPPAAALPGTGGPADPGAALTDAGACPHAWSVGARQQGLAESLVAEGRTATGAGPFAVTTGPGATAVAVTLAS